MKIEIKVTENYQIVIETNQYRLQQLCEIDPKKSPRYDPEKHGENPKIKKEWKDDGYYSLTTKGLEAAIKSVILKETNLSSNKKRELKEYLNDLERLSTDITIKVNNIINEK